MQKLRRLHENPYAAVLRNRGAVVKSHTYGRLLEAGDELEDGDVFASVDGTWQKCPCPGLKIMSGAETMWVRPD